MRPLMVPVPDFSLNVVSPSAGLTEMAGASTTTTFATYSGAASNSSSVMSLSRTLAVTVQTPEPSKVWRMFVLDGEP